MDYLGYKNFRFVILTLMSITIFSFPSTAGSDQSLANFLAESDDNADPKHVFGIVDADKNGTVNRSEFKRRKMAVFFDRDKNKDRKLSKDELSNVGAATFRAGDKDGDNYMSAFEFNQSEFVKFEAVDQNDDGAITFEEFIAFRQSLR